MHYNRPEYRFYVVNGQTIRIDSGWEHRVDAMSRAVALKEEGAINVKVMTRPRVWDQVLDPNDDKNWTARQENPASVVKTKRDERLWKMAKKSAADQERAEDWPYIMGIFQRMKKRVGGGEMPRQIGGRRDNPVATRELPRKGECVRVSHLGRVVEGEVIFVDEGVVAVRDAAGADHDFGVHHTLRWERLAPRKNPGELLVVNPRENPIENDTARAERVYAMWHKKEPHNAFVLKTGCREDDGMVCVGRAHNIVYRSGKWEKGRKTNDYVHHFDSKPKVWMVTHLVEGGSRADGDKCVGDLLSALQNGDGKFAVADLASPISLGLDDGTSEGEDIKIHAGARVYGGVDKKTVIICDPHWKLIVIKGGQMHFDERGIVK